MNKGDPPPVFLVYGAQIDEGKRDGSKTALNGMLYGLYA